jgi:hypothetical protein
VDVADFAERRESGTNGFGRCLERKIPNVQTISHDVLDSVTASDIKKALPSDGPSESWRAAENSAQASFATSQFEKESFEYAVNRAVMPS